MGVKDVNVPKLVLKKMGELIAVGIGMGLAVSAYYSVSEIPWGLKTLFVLGGALIIIDNINDLRKAGDML